MNKAITSAADTGVGTMGSGRASTAACMIRGIALAVGLLLLGVAAVAACDTTPAAPAAPGAPAAPAVGGAAGAATLIAAGDIASCSSEGDEQTAALLDDLPGTVATLGDLAYRNGTAAEFANCYGPSWGRHRARTRPAVGNHEYLTTGARPYFDYFGAAAGEPGRGYYSYDLGDWHVVVLNSECSQIGGCQAGSAQERWLRADLAASNRRCQLAYWHRPLFTSGREHDNETRLRPLFQALYEAGAEVVLTGHNHNYERFAPQTPTGKLDTARGIRQFVVGTGGASHYEFAETQPNSEVRNSGTRGVLRLDLRPDGYDWRFLAVAGASFTDVGSGTCH